MHILPPAQNSDFGFYNNYVAKAISAYPDLITGLTANWDTISKLISSLTEEQLLYRYADGKWSVKETVQHLIDAERNFCYRIMRFSRKDQGDIPGYDIHAFVINSDADKRDIKAMMDEYSLLRKASILMFSSMTEEMLELQGPARNTMISVRALGFAMAGHVLHHIQLLDEKYQIR